MVLVPEAFESQPQLKDKADIKAFYSYYESLQEAWDGDTKSCHFALYFDDCSSVRACSAGLQ